MSHYNYVWLQTAYVHGPPRPARCPCRISRRGALIPLPYHFDKLCKDNLTWIARYLDINDWAALYVWGQQISSRKKVQIQARLRLGYVPRDPKKAIQAYNVLRSDTCAFVRQEMLVGTKWANWRQHLTYDSILKLWSPKPGHINFVTSRGFCGAYQVSTRGFVMKRLARRGSFFNVSHVDIGFDGAICVAHSRGMSICSNDTPNTRSDMTFMSTTYAVVCIDSTNVFATLKTNRSVFRTCISCMYGNRPHLMEVSGRYCTGVMLMRKTRGGVMWKVKRRILCFCLKNSRRALPPTEISGPGSVHYVSDPLPSGTTPY